jgi:DNA-binding NtrC family response regulator
VLGTILIVDDEESICQNLKTFFKAKGFNVHVANDGQGAIELCQSISMDLVLLDLHLPDVKGLDVLKSIKVTSPGTAVIIITAYGDVETTVKAMKMKADNFVLKPIDLAVLEAMVEKSLESYRTQAEFHYFKRKVSQLKSSVNLDTLRVPREVSHLIQLLAENSSTNVLLLGETGTGKGVVANTIHEISDRRNCPLVDINCAGLGNELLESELFGHERGAFTDAKNLKRGLLEVANRGSIFLDEIGELSLSVQAKLLKIIEKRTFRRLGGTSNIEVDVRIMAATNTNLEMAVKNKMFREDLYFRLNVMPIILPPLRERRNDILPLANIFLKEFNKLFSKEISGFSEAAESMLLYYSWPGNIRELRNIVERAVLLCGENNITTAHLPENLKGRKKSLRLPLKDDLSLESLEKKHLKTVLLSCDNNRTIASGILGIHRTTLIKKIKKYNL